MQSTARTKEKAVAGVTTGLISLNESVTWQAIHFGIRQRLTSRITQFNRPFHFRDKQVKGAFRYFIHDHTFAPAPHGTLMKDRFEFEAPFGIVGKIVSTLILKKYLTRFLQERNALIKFSAENNVPQYIIARKNYNKQGKN
jgi:ligand-binding SRPBCC domain-containing protein